MNKHLLAISWAMPPILSPRSIQVARLVASLQKYDWDTSFVCADPPESDTLFYKMDESFAARYAKHYALQKVSYSSTSTCLEDRWVQRATNAAIKTMGERTFDAFITFAQPFSDHLVGINLKKRFPGLPWVAHFSDPWVDNPYLEPLCQDFVAEHLTIALADAVIFTTDRTLRLVMKKYPESWRSKCHVLPHGFEGECTPARIRPPKQDMLLVHTGNLYGRRIPFALLDALAQLRSEGICCRARFVGEAQKSFFQHIQDLRLENLVQCATTVSSNQLTAYYNDADILLACDAPASESVFLPSKLLDYMTLGLPILALTPENGSSADFLREVGGIIAPPDDASAIASVLRSCNEHAKTGTLHSLAPREAAALKYSITNAASSMNAILCNTTAQPASSLPHYCSKLHETMVTLEEELVHLRSSVASYREMVADLPSECLAALRENSFISRVFKKLLRIYAAYIKNES
ncbi:glycosyltransferase [Desulfovibrio sp.]|uniref:glycosyltransferase n=1 Tax=Desulfovibrio sp. TaxID=885 RepID=UPI0025C404F9|nr:glycosyltransferase [Desulfovibrio sp.]